jgi:hypothetical protein
MSAAIPSLADAEYASVRPLISTDGAVRLTLSTTSAATAVSTTAFIASGVASALTAQTISGSSLNGTIGQSAMGVPRQFTFTLTNHADWDVGTLTITAKLNGVSYTESLTVANGGNATLTTTGYYDQLVSVGISAMSGTGGALTAGYNTLIAAGTYAVALDKTGGLCYLCFGATAVLPTTGLNTPAGTFVVSDRDTIRAPGGTAVSAILTGSGTTGELALVRLR